MGVAKYLKRLNKDPRGQTCFAPNQVAGISTALLGNDPAKVTKTLRLPGGPSAGRISSPPGAWENDTHQCASRATSHLRVAEQTWSPEGRESCDRPLHPSRFSLKPEGCEACSGLTHKCVPSTSRTQIQRSAPKQIQNAASLPIYKYLSNRHYLKAPTFVYEYINKNVAFE